jgi:hypothetical protein
MKNNRKRMRYRLERERDRRRRRRGEGHFIAFFMMHASIANTE